MRYDGIVKRAIVCLVGAALTAISARAQAPFRFEIAPRVALATPRVHDPRFVLRASRSLTLLAIQEVYGRSRLIATTSLDGGDNFFDPVPVTGSDVSVLGSGESGPALALTGDGMCAAWEQSRPLGGSELVVAASPTGAVWAKPRRLTDVSGKPAGFVALAAAGSRVVAVWLDGRAGAAGKRDVYLARSLDGGKTFEKNQLVAAGVCSSSRPAVALGEEGAVFVAWRGVTAESVRDIYVAASTDGGVTFAPPVNVAPDGWKSTDCPASAPALAVSGKTLHVAWYSEGKGKRDVGLRWTTSMDGGASFSMPQLVSHGVLDPNHPELTVNPQGRVYLVFQGRPDAGDGWSPFKAYIVEVSDWVTATHGAVAPPGAYDKVSYPTGQQDAIGRLWVFWTAGEAILLSRAREILTP